MGGRHLKTESLSARSGSKAYISQTLGQLLHVSTVENEIYRLYGQHTVLSNPSLISVL